MRSNRSKLVFDAPNTARIVDRKVQMHNSMVSINEDGAAFQGTLRDSIPAFGLGRGYPTGDYNDSR